MDPAKDLLCGVVDPQPEVVTVVDGSGRGLLLVFELKRTRNDRLSVAEKLLEATT